MSQKDQKARMQGNRKSEYSMLVAAKGYYHIEIIKRVHIAKESRYDENHSIQMFTPQDYKIWKDPESQKVNGIWKAILLHDPILQEKIDVEEAAKLIADAKAKAIADAKAIKEAEEAEVKKLAEEKKLAEKLKMQGDVGKLGKSPSKQPAPKKKK